MFGMYLGYTTQQSVMHFGGYSDAYVLSEYSAEEKVNKTAEELINWMDLTSKTYWQISLNEVNVGYT
jgi:hypothetical protein